nr:Chain C, Decapeptide: SER-SER-THR-ARG-GLY-ILE-SER-GLN-LEU-TRP [synthetic construct]
SSTRGISQLW